MASSRFFLTRVEHDSDVVQDAGLPPRIPNSELCGPPYHERVTSALGTAVLRQEAGPPGPHERVGAHGLRTPGPFGPVRQPPVPRHDDLLAADPARRGTRD